MLLFVMAMVMSSGFRPFACMAWGSILITIERVLPPNGAGAVIPGMSTNMGLIFVRTRVCISLIESLSLSNTNCPTGSELPSKRTTIGGTAPAGRKPMALETDVETSPATCAMLVPG
ncbi:hypothetical protein D3C72_1513890 [compost metagenome]